MQDIIYMISVKAESDGTLTDIRALRLKDGTRLPTPISSAEYANAISIGSKIMTVQYMSLILLPHQMKSRKSL